MRPASSTVLRVRGARAATAAATCGQRMIWECLQLRGPDEARFNDGGLAEIPPGTTLAAVEQAVTTFLRVHDTFRTTLEWRAGRLHQVVSGDGDLAMPIEETVADRAEETARAVLDRLRATPLRVWTRWPVHIALVVAAGAPRYLVVVYHRIALDREGVRLVVGQMNRLLRGEPPHPAPGQPVDQAAREQSAAGRALRAGFADKLRSTLEQTPPSIFDFPELPYDGDRARRLRMWSAAASLALEGIAARHRVTSAAVLLAAAGVALWCYTGHANVPMCVYTENRAADGHAGLVGTLTVEVPVRLDLRDAGWSELLARALEANVNAHLLAPAYDPEVVNAVRRAQSCRHGGYVDLAVHVNDARQGPPVAVREPARRLRERMADTVVKPGEGWARTDTRFQLGAYGSPGDMELTLWADAAYVPVPAMRAILLGIERLLVTAYEEPPAVADLPAVTGIEPARPSPGAVRHVRGGWVDPAGSARLWQEVAGAPGTLLTEEVPGRPGVHRLVAWVAGPAGGALPDLHRRFVTALGTRTDIRAADEYRRCATAPSAESGPAGWRAAAVVEVSDGR